MRSCSAKVAGWLGGPHQRSSSRGSAQSCQTRSTGASNSAVSVIVKASKSFFTSVTGMVRLSLLGGGLGEDSVDALDPAAPERLEPVERLVGATQGIGLGVDDLFAPAPLFADQAGPLEQRHVFLDRGEADRVEPGERRYRELGPADPAEDVAAGGVAERLEQQVGRL